MTSFRHSLMLFLLLPWFTRATELPDSLTDQISATEGYPRIGALIQAAYFYSDLDSARQAIQLFEQALSELESRERSDPLSRKLEAKAKLGMGFVTLFSTAEYERSLELLLSAREIAEEINDSASLAEANRNLGFNYRFLAKYSQALSFLENAVIISEAIGDTGLWISSLNEKANAHYFLKDIEACRKYRLEALHYAELSHDTFARHYIIHDLAFLFLEEKDYRNAQNHFLGNMNYSLRTGNAREISIAAENVGATYLEMGMTDSALFYLNIADSVSRKSGLVQEQSAVLHTYNQLYAGIKRFDKAYEYLLRYHALNDSIFTIEKERQINELTIRYETAQKEQENLILRHQYRNTLIIIIIVSGFVLLIFLLLGLMTWKECRVNKELERRNETIRLQKERLDMALETLKKHGKELEESNASKDLFFSIIAHDLRNPFNTLLGLSDVLNTEYDSFSSDEIRLMIRNINDSAERLYKLLENLLEWAHTQTRRLQIHPEKFDIAAMIRDNISFFSQASETKSVALLMDGCQPAEVSADRKMVDFVLRNLLANALKYVHKGGEVVVRIVKEAGFFVVSVEDNGVGITGDNLQKLFRIDGKVKTSGTMNEQGTGLGLIICREFIELNGGKIWVESEAGKGSRFSFTLPAG
jgi:signal transduction histidine kinase